MEEQGNGKMKRWGARNSVGVYIGGIILGKMGCDLP
jgi:hypothetical protein